jgi:hypothetical protein
MCEQRQHKGGAEKMTFRVITNPEKMSPEERAARAQAARELAKYDHCFLNADLLAHFAKAFGLKNQIKPRLEEATPNEVKGLTFFDGASWGVDLDAAELAHTICKLLGVEHDDGWGRGVILERCCSALEKHFA